MPTSMAVDQGRTRVDLAGLIEMRHRVREIRLFSMPNRGSPLSGVHHSRLRGRGVDFDQVRVYQSGDDVRNIDWRVTARTQVPHTKLFHEERERPVFILAEQSQRLFFGSAHAFKSVVVARAAALLGWACLDHNDRIGGLVFGDRAHHEVKPRRSKQSLLQLFNHLERFSQGLSAADMATPDALVQALRRAREVLRPGNLAIVLCDERGLDDQSEQQLILLGRHVELMLLPVYDPLDRALPVAGLLRFQQSSGQDSAELELDTNADALRAGYAALAQARMMRWQQLAQRLNVMLLPLSSAEDVVDQLRDQLDTRIPGRHR
ncbi:DUF58 domain-containing protein [Pseudomonas matsuisoli]|uniref:DUF58 domain-containing protein n=1 Tax=Pseudomonas matsuisoli TaxID=1515666 RepID=A0A917PLV8_9PSED|nr:DUF58 domain-containing protein [Pseudomonas matsuisoli]GGJ84038.1 hypothetical protein GCM10009304_07550 [Pseudomonas matsuisoli]